MKKTKQTALTAAMFAAAMGMSACSKLPMQETESQPDIYYYSATENNTVSASLMRGDINGDGDITVADTVLLRKYLKNQQTFTKKQFKRADVNWDGVVNIFDTVAQKRVLIYGDWILEYPETEAETQTEYNPETDEPVCEYGPPPEYYETTEPAETEYDPETDFPVDVYGPPWDYEETTELTETIPQPVYGPPEWFETTEPADETDYDPETEEQYDVYGPPAWFEETTEPVQETYLIQPDYGAPVGDLGE